MKDLVKTANILDMICRIAAIAIRISAAALLVGLGILAAGSLFGLPPQMIGTGWGRVDVGFVTFTVADPYLPDHQIILCQLAAKIFLSFLCLIPSLSIVKSFRAILTPMKNGEPFHNTISIHLGKVARYVCFLGIGINLLQIISSILLIRAYDLNILLLSEKIPHAEFHFIFDLSFLLISGILLLLSYVFRYGEELQQLSDETL